MRYLGNKTKLLKFIEQVIKTNSIDGDVFADLFAGTCSVGDYFKGTYKIVANDFLYYSYVLCKAKLMNKSKPKFSTFRKTYKEDIFSWLNSLAFIPDDTYFIYNNYTPKGNRMFFTENNGIAIDGIRQTIEKLLNDKVIKENEYYFLLGSLLESITKVSNISGTYEAYFKFWEARALKSFTLKPLDICIADNLKKNEIYCQDTNSLIKKISGDIAYIDPPYTVTQYISAYHLFETLVKYDNPTIKGVGGKRHRLDKNSLYAQKTKVKTIFEDLFRQIQFNHVLVSYSNQGLLSLDELSELAKIFAVDNKVQINHFEYQEYQNHRSSNKGDGKNLNEVVLYFKKDLSINKSPLNYQGSKDVVLNSILKELPPNVETFVDAMGGAFNVGANVLATKKVVYNELNPYIYKIINWLLSDDKDKIIKEIENIISVYKLDKANKDSYNKLRDDYNHDLSIPKLYVLHMYSFQNMIRFNNSQKFNTPVGVAGYSDDIKNRILNFKVKCPKYELMNLDYLSINWESYSRESLFYFDPPYSITSASYNDGKRGVKGWTTKDDDELLLLLSKLDSEGYKFMLSNVIKHQNKLNHKLISWVEKNNYKCVNVGISGWRYAKNEVIIKNY